MRITEALVTEHAVFLKVFEQIERVLPGLTTLAEYRTMAGLVEGLLAGHAKAETNLAYLALDHVLANSGSLTQMHQDHQEMDGRLRMVHQAGTCDEAQRLLRQAMAHSREHFRREERSLFPMLEEVLQEGTLAELGRTWLEDQPVNPERAHE
jgi:hemerythrin-like domain-containing protein